MMKSKILKKTLAAALALTIVGGVPYAFGGADIFTPSIVADAAMTKTIAAGNVYRVGDTILMGDSPDGSGNVWVYSDSNNPSSVIDSNHANIAAKIDSVVFATDSWSHKKKCYVECVDSNGSRLTSFTITPTDEELKAEPLGIIVTSGDGTLNNPYKLDVLTSNTKFPALGEEYYLGDTIDCRNSSNNNVILNDNTNSIYNISGIQCKIDEIGYNDSTKQYYYYSQDRNYSIYVSSPKFKNDVVGIRVADGDGTSSSPYTFEPIVDGAVKTLAAGNDIYPGDTIVTGDDDVYIKWNGNITNIKEKSFKIGAPQYLDSYGQYLFPCGEENFGVWIESDELPSAPLGFRVSGGSGTADDPYTFRLIKSEVELTSANVALDDSISLNFYAPKESVDSANIENVVLTGANDPIETAKADFKEVTVKDTDYYVFTYPMYATQISEDVTIQFFDDEDEIVNITDKGRAYSYTINDYCEKVIAEDTSPWGSYETDAAKSLRNLGFACENYFNGKLRPIEFILNREAAKDRAELSSTKSWSDGKAKISLVLDSKLAVRLYIKGLPAGEETYVDHNRIESFKGKGTGDYANCFEIGGFKPNELDCKNTDNYIRIFYDNYFYEFNPLTYCALAMDSDDTATQNIGQAVYEYYSAVKNYVDNLN